MDTISQRNYRTLWREIPESTYQHWLYKSVVSVVGTATNQLFHTCVTVTWLITGHTNTNKVVPN